MIRLIVTILSTLMVSACIPMYKMSEDQDSAYIKSMGMGRVQMCKEGKMYRLPTNKEGYHLVPTEERITLSKFVYIDQYMMAYSCQPALSFIPKADDSYIINLDFLHSGCRIELVKKDENVDLGFSREPTLSEPSCK